MKLYKDGERTVFSGEMSRGALYISPKDADFWLEIEGVSNIHVTDWNAVKAKGQCRIIRFLRLLPFVWRASK